MLVQVAIGRDGKLGLAVKRGTYAEGKQALDELVRLLQAEGISFSEIGPVEQHRHDDHDHEHARERTNG